MIVGVGAMKSDLLSKLYDNYVNLGKKGFTLLLHLTPLCT